MLKTLPLAGQETEAMLKKHCLKQDRICEYCTFLYLSRLHVFFVGLSDNNVTFVAYSEIIRKMNVEENFPSFMTVHGRNTSLSHT